MAAGATYTPIATVTASGVSTFLVMSSIPSTYTDLVLIGNYFKSAAASASIRFNSDTATNYSQTAMTGNGTATNSGRETSQTSFYLMDFLSASTSEPNISITHIMNYSNTTTNKTVLDRGGAAGQGTAANVGLWRSTSAINRIDILTGTGTFSSGTTFTLYGIAAA